jgi:hypothetical protein
LFQILSDRWKDALAASSGPPDGLAGIDYARRIDQRARLEVQGRAGEATPKVGRRQFACGGMQPTVPRRADVNHSTIKRLNHLVHVKPIAYFKKQGRARWQAFIRQGILTEQS